MTDLNELERLLKERDETEYSWRASGGMREEFNKANGALRRLEIAAVNALPSLIERVRELEKEVSLLKEADAPKGEICNNCDSELPRGCGGDFLHETPCRLRQGMVAQKIADAAHQAGMKAAFGDDDQIYENLDQNN